MSTATKRHLPTLTINDTRVSVEPRETILQAALRSGIAFPNSCRVGGCGACKCRLTEGRVKELTETGYLLSAEELEGGYILACQSLPRGDLRVEVELAPERPVVFGRIARRETLTHDIVALHVELEEPLSFTAGQYANLGIEGLPEVSRSYSFASAPDGSAQVKFFVRKVPGGLFSSFVHEEDLVGRKVTLDAPHGDFWLRPSDAPILLVAGGSGLAPVLSLLESALRDRAPEGVARPVTLLFGAREQRDLYALGEIEALAAGWGAPFRFIPILSSAEHDEAWRGKRGLVTDELVATIEELRGSFGAAPHAYLCGPPALIDRAMDVLGQNGVAREHVHFDKFTTRADGLVAEAPPTAEARSETERDTLGARIVAVLHYLKFFSFHAVGLFAAFAILVGGPWVTAGLLGVLAFYIVGDAISGDDTSTPSYRHPGILTAQLWLALPLLTLIVFSAVWSVSSGDPLAFGATVSRLFGHDVLAARDATSWGHHVSAWALTGLMIGMIGTITGHELTHRTWDPISMLVGRWLLAFSFDTSFAIEHVYGHHRYVSTTEDPATAPRGRNVYVHVLLSTVTGNVSAWNIEAARLRKKRHAVLSPRNAFLRGHAMSLVLVALAFLAGGLHAALFFVACALMGKALLEIVNYMEHYGMVRNPKLPVQPRHSWNTNRRLSSWTLFNLTRHSHHHAQGEVPYHELKPYADAPMMIGGYLTTLSVAMIPPLWHYLMTPKVLAWDRDYASSEERELAERANATSGIAALLAARAMPRQGVRAVP